MHTDQVGNEKEDVLLRSFPFKLCRPHCTAIAVGLSLYRCHCVKKYLCRAVSSRDGSRVVHSSSVCLCFGVPRRAYTKDEEARIGSAYCTSVLVWELLVKVTSSVKGWEWPEQMAKVVQDAPRADVRGFKCCDGGARRAGLPQSCRMFEPMPISR
jgi:hypothetical protein